MWRILRVCSSAKTRLFKSLDWRHLVTAHDIETFQTQGVVCLRGAFREWVEKLKKGIATNHATPATTAVNGSKAKIRRPSTSMIILTGVGSQSLRNLCVYRQLQKSPANWWSLRFVLSQKGSPEALLLNHIYEKFWYSKKKGGWVNKLCPIPIEDMQFHLTSNITDFMVCCQATWPLFLLPGILFAHGAFHILSPTPLY